MENIFVSHQSKVAHHHNIIVYAATQLHFLRWRETKAPEILHLSSYLASYLHKKDWIYTLGVHHEKNSSTEFLIESYFYERGRSYFKGKIEMDKKLSLK